jgi:Histidine phosphatase superfamily (branch 2)
MLTLIISILFTLTHLILSSNSHDTCISTLKLVQIVARHGDRNPTTGGIYPNDPHKDPKFWPDGFGELITKGKERMYEFGKKLRERYAGYLSETPKEVYVRSSSTRRSIESAQCLLAGLYPPIGRWIWSKDNQLANYWQPIGIESVETERDILLKSLMKCPATDDSLHQVMNSDEVKLFLSSQKDFIDQLSHNCGIKYTELKQLYDLSDYLRVQIMNGVNKPEWVDLIGNDTLERLFEFEKHYFLWRWSTEIIKRLRAGPLLKVLSENMKKASLDQTDVKLYYYSTHDTKLVVLMQALGIYNNSIPNYGSALLFELHQIEDKFQMKTFYVDDTTKEPIQVFLPNCSHPCDLNDFIDSIETYIPTDWYKECGLKLDESNGYLDRIRKIIIHIIIGFAIGVGMMLFLCACKTREPISGKYKKLNTEIPAD